MKTPIQELINYYKFTKEHEAILGAKSFLEKEKEFAKQCFEAGRKLEASEWMDIMRALPEKQLSFEEWYKKFE